MALRIIK